MALPVMQQQQRLNPARGLYGADRTETHGMPTTTPHTMGQRPRRDAESPRRLPATRRQSLRRVKDSKEELRRTRTRGTSSATLDSTAPSTAPSGRSFTVANVNRGIIYLRPVVRAGNQRGRPTPEPFVFPPQTPPDSASPDTSAQRPLSNDWDDSPYGSRTPTRSASRPPPRPVTPDDALEQLPAHFASSPPRATAHLRARSFSTADEHTLHSHSTEPGTFKVVIERPPFAGRPKTADTGSLPLLEIPIPHYRLGTPRFSARGTAILRSSTYTRRTSASDDFRSSLLNPQRATHSFLFSRPRSDAYPPLSPSLRPTMDPAALQASSYTSSARVSQTPIGPQIYDALTANPDDPAVVRFSPSGDILAATPSRLVAHITSPSFLDYELLSDFFLTFRSFLSSRDLAAYLIARLRWAVNRQDDFGRIVRVRTFVALRHWILNYFVDDFVPLYKLRVYFCELVNSLHGSLRSRHDGGGGDIKIVGELKKCWRRTCALYWDSDDGVGRDMDGEDLLPGGRGGSHDSLNEDDLEMPPPRPSTPPRQTGHAAKPEATGPNPHMDWAQKIRHTPQHSLSTPYHPSHEHETANVPLSPASEQSMQVLSCSIPLPGRHRAEPGTDVPLYPHPVPHPVPVRLAASPQHSTSIKRPKRPTHAHKRSGSFSDALRDRRAPLSIPKNTAADVAISAVSRLPGTLVRGGIFQPGSPYVDVKNSDLRHTRSHLELQPDPGLNADLQTTSGYAAHPGMKKIIGSVRRALSSRQSPTQPQFSGLKLPQHSTPSARSSNPTANSVSSGGISKRRQTRTRTQVRIDVLASRVAESFNAAVKDELRTELDQPHDDGTTDLGGFTFDFEERQAAAANDRLKNAHGDYHQRMVSSITAGSKSIVIVDATGAPEVPIMPDPIPGSSNAKHVEEAAPEQFERSNGLEELPTAIRNDMLHSRGTSELLDLNEYRPKSWTSTQRSIVQQGRSVSEGRDRERMHSFRRRGSTRASRARSGSLRRHASYNSGLSRHYATASLATFQTMSSDNDPFFLDRNPPNAANPTRQLRRRPGGDLRAVDNVHDLEHVQRPHSTGSVSNRTHSVANSVILHSDRYTGFLEETAKLQKGPNESAEPKKKRISLVDTHSSQPNLRPSFEAEVAKLAALPDDIDDDGGIESALMKLEGRYEKRSPELSPKLGSDPDVYRPSGMPVAISGPSVSSGSTPIHSPKMEQPDDTLHRPLAPPEAEGQGMYRLSGENFTRRVPAVQSTIESEDSYSSVPLLDRGLSDVMYSTTSRTAGSMASSAKPAPLNPMSRHQLPDSHAAKPTSPTSSIEYVVETESMKRIPRNGTLPRSSIARESFLLDDDEDLSDASDADITPSRSEDTSHGVRSFFEDETPGLEHEKGMHLTHPMRHPPTPPLTANRLNDPLPQVDTTVFDRGLPTPGLTPTSRLNNQSFGNISHPSLSRSIEAPIELQELKPEASTLPAHLPFILAYDSEKLAQQFTIVEKDALDEIDWKELIELRWKQSSPQIRDWVDYLRTQEARGVDVTIARFNMVVKWAVSECLLTESIEERARCIVKYIHIAAHARRLRNYATMYQITVALLSADVARLSKTWARIPAMELQTMKELEALVQPLKNFHNLRVEMETATVEEGCIPFIGIYTRDLIYNAQKPAFIDKPIKDGERLVNFERQHTAASIVKSLLRLLEASSKYTFKPDPTIISRCLWMSALGDDELTALSRKYE